MSGLGQTCIHIKVPIAEAYRICFINSFSRSFIGLFWRLSPLMTGASSGDQPCVLNCLKRRSTCHFRQSSTRRSIYMNLMPSTKDASPRSFNSKVFCRIYWVSLINPTSLLASKLSSTCKTNTKIYSNWPWDICTCQNYFFNTKDVTI